MWYGLVAPPTTPPDVIAKLNDAFNTALKLPQVTKIMDTNGMVTGRLRTTKEFSAFIQSELGIWGPVIRKSGIKLE